ncbi:hypothetical protein TSIB_0518 [Thermococcus sibiricus MM 739]|uniref:Uncharacterized protein n=1 Tax=Thermococcus sibiricus (strain DSM 12597 / MM 739) TaxID=604354 RepID=C6A1T9_THESM|nr:hypothetical protein TSIB_0518 [Thermococcus sibiricus MM 739]
MAILISYLRKFYTVITTGATVDSVTKVNVYLDDIYNFGKFNKIY